tara:strand:- start:35 stop:283 length:249 start_codon:yes stop_codon:yes gene_type:complete
MIDSKENRWKKYFDDFLIFNLYILIVGAVILALSFILSINGFTDLYILFQKLWYPIFIPSLSLFFTAILVEAIVGQVIKGKK